MKEPNFAFLRQYLRSRCGIVLTEAKAYLVESRLLPVARRAALSDLDALVAVLRQQPDGLFAAEIVDAMTTGETFFFRDRKPFDQLRDQLLPELLAARESLRTIRIWCAACSTGQEPYSLAMLLREVGARLDGWRVEIVATDIAQSAIERAKRGVYSQFEVQRGLSVKHLLKYFTRTGENWHLAPEITRMVRFQTANLLGDFASLGRFDIIFCRNVLIYFEAKTKTDVLDRLSRVLRPDGALLLGGPETTLGLTRAFVAHPTASMFSRVASTADEAPQPSLRLVRA